MAWKPPKLTGRSASAVGVWWLGRMDPGVPGNRELIDQALSGRAVLVEGN
jgi:hypothetical protein